MRVEWGDMDPAAGHRQRAVPLAMTPAAALAQAERDAFDALLRLLLDNESVTGRLVTTAVVLVLAVAVAVLLAPLPARRAADPYTRYHVRKLTRAIVALVTAVVLAVLWRPFAGQIGVVLGFAAAGIAFAMQEVIGALAGWVNIVSGRVFGVGDRIKMGGAHGDVIDITPLRTKILEIGAPSTAEGPAQDGGGWVRGRQYTGRIVAVSNKATFTEPVFNYSAAFEYLWEELSLPVPHDADWARAEQIMLDEARRVSRSEGAQAAMRQMTRRYPVPITEVQPRVFLRATDNWIELTARFVVPLRTARSVKDQMTRRVLAQLEEAGIPVASQTLVVRPEG
ncbi:MAG: mechanosensitive ion channel family protein [Candidatus Nanopelagicales bacterium]|jgi:small-conductance mechanosensitive channel|nr:mechanosensitive ion channel family protein [Candidatus Nanopelagicales bacterium]